MIVGGFLSLLVGVLHDRKSEGEVLVSLLVAIIGGVIFVIADE